MQANSSRISQTKPSVIHTHPHVGSAPTSRTCPPAFGNYHQKQKIVRHHYDTKHARRDTSVKAIQKLRRKQHSKDKVSQPQIEDGYKRSVQKRIASIQRDLAMGGHSLQSFLPDWVSWPWTKQHKGKKPVRKGYLFTCKQCWRIAHYDTKQWKNTCLASKASPTTAAQI